MASSKLLATTALLALFACSTRPAPVTDTAADRALFAELRQEVAALGPDVRAAIWLGPAGEPPTLAWNVEQPMPTASAIKAAYLVEFFAAYVDALDRPLADVRAILTDAEHPAVAHFTAAQRATALEALGSATPRRLGEAMITGKGVDNVTYNIAANLVTALAGGPAWLEAKLHARTPAFADLRVRRYMLADRTTTGDNEATAHALAAVHAGLARRDLPGVSRLALDAARTVLAGPADRLGRATFQKGGALDSEPVTRVEAGFREGPDGAVVHVVMLAWTGVPAAERAAAGQRLGELAKQLAQRLQRPAR
jgi:hypothetical protein